MHMARVILDDSPVEFAIRGPSINRAPFPIIDPWQIQDPKFRDKIREGSDFYFKENAGLVDSHLIIWEAYKVVLRGPAQALIGSKRKEKSLQIRSIEQEMLQMEAEVIGGANADQLHRLALRQQELRALAEGEARAYAVAMQHQLYEVCDKASSLLAWLEKRDRE